MCHPWNTEVAPDDMSRLSTVGFLSCRTMCPIGSFVGRIFVLQNHVSHRRFCLQDFYPVEQCVPQEVLSVGYFSCITMCPIGSFVGRIFILCPACRTLCPLGSFGCRIFCPLSYVLQNCQTFCKIFCNTVASFVAMMFCLLGGCFDVGRFVPLVVVLAQDVFSPWLSFWRWTFCPLDGRFSV